MKNVKKGQNKHVQVCSNTAAPIEQSCPKVFLFYVAKSFYTLVRVVLMLFYQVFDLAGRALAT